MKYDRDIRWMRFIAWIMIATDLIWLGRNVHAHDWINAITSAIWTANCYIWLGTLKAQQRTRDNLRVTDAAVQAVMEQRER